MTQQPAAPGRRERHKQRTREALLDAARTLFASQGFTATTVAQIAERADVSERTFFRYFDAKEDLLLPDLTARFAAVAAAVAQRPVGEPALVSVREAALALVDGGIGFAAVPADLDPADPLLAARMVKVFLAFEDELTEVLRVRMAADGDRDDFVPAVVAHAGAAALRAALRTFRAHVVRGEPTPPLAELVGRAFDVLQTCGRAR